MFSAWTFREAKTSVVFDASGFPPPRHRAEPDLFCRQVAVPGHRQNALEAAHVMIVGCGGLGSWIAVALARMGVSQITLSDPDVFDRSNAARQLLMPADLGRPKAHVLAHRIVSHMTNAGHVRGLAVEFDRAVNLLNVAPSLLVVGVDNNRARLQSAAWAKQHRVSAVFAMLSSDGLRAHIFRQDAEGPCLSCVLPNLERDAAMPCAAASMASCLLAGSHAVMMAVASLAGDRSVPTWRETSLDGTTERVARPLRRKDCPLCERTQSSSVTFNAASPPITLA